MPLLEYACVKCGPLDVVSKVLAILHLIAYIIASLGWFFVVYVIFILGDYGESQSRQAFRTHGGSQNNAFLDETMKTTQSIISLYIGVIKFVVAFTEVVFIVQVIALCVLIHGIRKDNQRLLFPWIIVQAVTIVWNIVSFIIILAIFKSNTPADWGVGFPVNIIIAGWFLVVVYSLYQQMGERVAGRNDINMK